MNNACKVITVYIGTRRDSKTNNPETPAECIELFLEHLLPNEYSIDKGVPCDTIIIDHSTESQYINMVSEFNNTRTVNGMIRVHNLPNIGGSFGGYNQAYQLYKDKYKYWCFVEDDVIINAPNYYRRAVSQLEINPNLAYVAITPIAIPNLHAAGGCGITSIDWLNLQAGNNNGDLIHPNIPTNYQDMMPNQRAEEEFTYFFTQRGYGIQNIAGFSPYPINIEQHDPFFRLRPQLNNDVGDKLYYIGLYNS